MSKLIGLKKETSALIICVICLTVTTLSVSYSMFFGVDDEVSGVSNSIGDIIVDYKEGTNIISENKLSVLSDYKGEKVDSQSLIYIQNNGKLDTTVKFLLEEKNDNKLNANDLKLAIYEFDPSTNISVKVSDTIRLSDTIIVGMENDKVIYSLFDNIIGHSSSGENAKTYTIKYWLDEGSNAINKKENINYELIVIANSDNNLKKVNLSGVLNLNNVAISNATVSLNNGSYKSVSNDLGVFSINNITEGLYTFDIIVNENLVYNGTVKILAGDKTSINLLPLNYINTNKYNKKEIAYKNSSTEYLINNLNKEVKDNKYKLANTYKLEVKNEAIVKINVGDKVIEKMEIN